MTYNYSLLGQEVEAYRHDGTNDSAEKLATWAKKHGEKIEVFPQGEYEWDLEYAYLRLNQSKYDRVVRPNFWLVRNDGGMFWVVYPDIFVSLYTALPVKEGSDEQIPAPKSDS